MGKRAICLTKRWAGREPGTRLWVLEPGDDVKRGHVDEQRADTLLADGFAEERGGDSIVDSKEKSPALAAVHALAGGEETVDEYPDDWNRNGKAEDEAESDEVEDDG